MATVFDGRTHVMTRRAAGTRGDIRQDQYGNFIVSQGLPKYTDLAVNRKIYSASSAAGTAQAPYIAVPTTTATWALYNGNSGNTQLIVLSIHAWLVSGVSGIGEFMFAGMSSAVQATAPTVYASSVNKGVSPGGSTNGGVFVNALTLAGAAAWQIWGANGGGSADVSDSSGMSENVEGMYVIPPGFALGLGIYNIGGATAKYGAGFTYIETDIELS